MTQKNNLTKKDFTYIYQVVLRDKTLNAFDRGMLITLVNLADSWEISVEGLSRILPDGKTAISSSLKRLTDKGYVRLSHTRDSKGKFKTTLEFRTPGEPEASEPKTSNHNRKTVTGNPSPSIRDGQSDTDIEPQYKENKKQNIKNSDNHSIILSMRPRERTKEHELTKEEECSAYRELIAKNIQLDLLRDAAERTQDPAEKEMVKEIYDTICDVVCFPRGDIIIKGAKYPWSVVKKQFLSLNYGHVSGVLNRVVNKSLCIQNMQQYLIATLYSESLCGTIKNQADLHDDYLMSLRGSPYAI
ncbi:MAG: hypothetical protein IKI15_05895 [Lachnospiraceae bacterium]|nr:hypothetical protein [Lachnospiraceae bacterium]